ncbi:MAG: hypothetical protein FWC64_10145 [Treponema sp.]|nr:hypothetical protein [Treponema sp.]
MPGHISELTGEAPGYLWWSVHHALRPQLSLDGRTVSVTFFFTNGDMDRFEINTENEGTTVVAGNPEYVDVPRAIASWVTRVNDGGIPAIPELPMNTQTPTAANPFHYQWSQEDLDAFSGGTISANALSRAAFYALYDFIVWPENGNGGGNGNNNNNGNGNGNGEELPPEYDMYVSGRAGGFLYAIGDFPADIAFVEVTLYFYEGAFVWVRTYTPFESDDYDPAIGESIREWAVRVRQGGILAIPQILPFNFEQLESQHHLWPPSYVDAFGGATHSINALTRAAHNALAELPPGFFGED